MICNSKTNRFQIFTKSVENAKN
ncbi:hypothetical protein FWK35_00016136 [Aphis craccivora]|uniref:Uncharacterized protein n=1 Tax=Aphis craccivora TaxID=307492 RepID=A0A6G0YWW3_APHCR|nr:hypothetical protein FWK35_00016136 [Aphis craccivora]